MMVVLLLGTIYLQGRTLYVGSGRSDVGLALAKDAKALLVQSENYAELRLGKLVRAVRVVFSPL